MNPVSLNSHTHTHASSLFSFPPFSLLTPCLPSPVPTPGPDPDPREGPTAPMELSIPLSAPSDTHKPPAPLCSISGAVRQQQSFRLVKSPSPVCCGVRLPESARPSSALSDGANGGVGKAFWVLGWGQVTLCSLIGLGYCLWFG